MPNTTPTVPTVDPVDLPVLPDAYPLASDGLAYLQALLSTTAADRRAQFAAMDPVAIATTFLAVTEVRALIEDVVRVALNRRAIDDFVSKGDRSVEVALRAHQRETPVTRMIVGHLQPYCVLPGATAAWHRERKHHEALVENERVEWERNRVESEAMREQQAKDRADAAAAARAFDERQGKRLSAALSPSVRDVMGGEG